MPYLNQYRKVSSDPHNSIVQEFIARLSELELTSIDQENQQLDEELTSPQRTQQDFLIFHQLKCYEKGLIRPITYTYLPEDHDGESLVVDLKFDNRSNTIKDGSLFENHAQLIGARPRIIPYTKQTQNHSYKFDGVSNRIKVTYDIDFDFSAFTFSLWLYPETSNQNPKVILEKNVSSFSAGSPVFTGDGGYCLYFDDDHDLHFDMRIGSSTVQVNTDNIKINGIDKWYHIIVIWDGSNLALRVNNTELDTIASSGNFPAVSQDLFFSTSRTNEGLVGNLDEIFVYDRALRSDELDLLYNEDSDENISIDGLILWIRFDSGKDDESSNLSINYGFPFIKDFAKGHTVLLTGGTFDTNVPSNFSSPFRYRNYVNDQLSGYKMRGETYLRIPEKNNNFRLKEQPTGLSIMIEFMLDNSIAKQNDRFQTLFCKSDDPNCDYGYEAYIGLDACLYFFLRWNGQEKGVKTVDNLPFKELLKAVFTIDVTNITHFDFSVFMNIYLGGFKLLLEPVGVYSSQLPTSSKPINDFDLLISSSCEILRGQLQDNNLLFSLRAWNKTLTAGQVMNHEVNHLSISSIGVGRVATLDNTILVNDELPTGRIREVLEFDTTTTEFDEWIATYNPDAVPTGRILEEIFWNVDNGESFKVGTGIGGVGKSLAFDGLLSNNSHVDLDVIKPIRDKFSVALWFKYEGHSSGDDFGGLISQLDGMPSGNRIMVNATTIRFHGQFKNDSAKWSDFRVTVADQTNTWHHLAITHNGDKKDRFRIYYDGQLIFETKANGHLQRGSRGDTLLGKGEHRKYYFKGKIDELVVKKEELRLDEVIDLMLHEEPNKKNLMAYHKFDDDLKDETDNDFDGKKKGNVTFSTDLPP